MQAVEKGVKKKKDWVKREDNRWLGGGESWGSTSGKRRKG